MNYVIFKMLHILLLLCVSPIFSARLSKKDRQNALNNFKQELVDFAQNLNMDSDAFEIIDHEIYRKDIEMLYDDLLHFCIE